MEDSSSAQELYMLCGSQCTDVNFDNVSILGGSKGTVSGVDIRYS